MMDIVRKNDDKIDIKELSEKLGCKVVEISALKGTGIRSSSAGTQSRFLSATKR